MKKVNAVRNTVFLSSLLIFALFIQQNSYAAYQEKYLADGLNPRIDQNNVVYTRTDVYLYDLGKLKDRRAPRERQVSKPGIIYAGYNPAVSGRNIVWSDYRNQNNDIILNDMGSNENFQKGNGDDRGEFPVVTDLASQITPAVSGRNMVWQDYRNNNWDIYLYDMGPDGVFGTDDDRGEFSLAAASSLEESPAISGNTIVWESDGSIYLYDLGANNAFDAGSLDDRGPILLAAGYTPAIYGEKIVYTRAADCGQNCFNEDLFLLDAGPDGLLGTSDDVESQITSNPNQGFALTPVIYENNIVWRYDNGVTATYQIFYYGLGTDGKFGGGDDTGIVQLTDAVTDEPYARDPAIYGTRVVYQRYHSYRDPNGKVYILDLSRP